MLYAKTVVFNATTPCKMTATMTKLVFFLNNCEKSDYEIIPRCFTLQANALAAKRAEYFKCAYLSDVQ